MQYYCQNIKCIYIRLPNPEADFKGSAYVLWLGCACFLLKMIYHDQEMVQIYRPFCYDLRVFWLLVEENYPMADFLT